MVKLSNVWKGRLRAGTRGAGRIILGILVLTSSISGIGTLKGWVFPQSAPPIAEIAKKTINAVDLVKGFAIDCVTTYLTASSAQGTNLSRCFPNAAQLTVPSTPSLIVSYPMAYVSRSGPGMGDLNTYGVLVGVTEQSYPSAVPVRAYYQIPVSVYDGVAVRALDNLAAVDEPPPGVDVELGYPVTVPAQHPITMMLAGFASTFLTNNPCLAGTGEDTSAECQPAGTLDRYVTTDSGLTPIKVPYARATVTGVTAISDPPDNPADNSVLPVRVTVSATAPNYTPHDLSYPLKLRASGGNWFVAGIDPVPALADSDPQPAAIAPTGGGS
ncbi:conjugal transfer protein [Mycolicibacterium mageritense]|uniref:conjugal transfer protein n=1 Tax=Mycolicibacterium mageritense TaxID=53462 RepID=UPI001E62FD6F|nr:conjugal transfer protein [Mycolicibacterium mageritense]GJJ22973.1 hypothetical protein MTY414_66460 [Mycolicibacterium mageritense]